LKRRKPRKGKGKESQMVRSLNRNSPDESARSMPEKGVQERMVR